MTSPVLLPSSAPELPLVLENGTLRVLALGRVIARPPYVELTRASLFHCTATVTRLVPLDYVAEREFECELSAFDSSSSSARSKCVRLHISDLGDRPVFVAECDDERIVEVSPAALCAALRARGLRVDGDDLGALFGFTHPLVQPHLLALLHAEYDALLLPAAPDDGARNKRPRGRRARGYTAEERALKRQRRHEEMLVGVGFGVRPWTPVSATPSAPSNGSGNGHADEASAEAKPLLPSAEENENGEDVDVRAEDDEDAESAGSGESSGEEEGNEDGEEDERAGVMSNLLVLRDMLTAHARR